jgi:hypothetical protein
MKMNGEAAARVMAIRESIESAFADVPYPGDDNITRCSRPECLECADVANYFRGRTWHAHTLADLRQYQSDLPLLTPAALQYFLPAYMLVSLGAWAEADLIPFFILQMCLPSPPDEDARLRRLREEQFAIFTRQQRAAIAEYLLEWARSDEHALGAEDVPPAIERLLGHEAAA